LFHIKQIKNNLGNVFSKTVTLFHNCSQCVAAKLATFICKTILFRIAEWLENRHQTKMCLVTIFSCKVYWCLVKQVVKMHTFCFI